MKSLLLSIAILLSIPYSGNSQEFKVGIAGAFNNTWLLNSNVSNGNGDVDYKMTFGGQGGINLRYDVQDNIGWNMGILFSVHNQKYAVSGNEVQIKTSLKYIDIPLLFRAGRMDQGVYFEIGPQIGILTGASEDLTSSSPYYTSYSGRNVKSQFSGFDLAGIIGFGGSVTLSPTESLTVGLRFGYSFTDATKQFNEDELGRSIQSGSTSFADLAAHYTTGNNIEYTPTNRAFAGIFVSYMRSLQ